MEKSSLKEILHPASKCENANANYKQRRKFRNFIKHLISLTTFLSVAHGENQSLMKLFGINLLVGASVARKYCSIIESCVVTILQIRIIKQTVDVVFKAEYAELKRQK